MLKLVCASSGKTSKFLFGVSAPALNRIKIYIPNSPETPYHTIVQEVHQSQFYICGRFLKFWQTKSMPPGLSILMLWRCYWYMTLIARKVSPFVKMESPSAGCPKKDLGTELSTAEQGFAWLELTPTITEQGFDWLIVLVTRLVAHILDSNGGVLILVGGVTTNPINCSKNCGCWTSWSRMIMFSETNPWS